MSVEFKRLGFLPVQVVSAFSFPVLLQTSNASKLGESKPELYITVRTVHGAGRQ